MFSVKYRDNLDYTYHGDKELENLALVYFRVCTTLLEASYYYETVVSYGTREYIRVTCWFDKGEWQIKASRI